MERMLVVRVFAATTTFDFLWQRYCSKGQILNLFASRERKRELILMCLIDDAICLCVCEEDDDQKCNKSKCAF